MRKSWRQRTVLVVLAAVGLCALGAECRAAVPAPAAQAAAPPCHDSAPQPAPAGAPAPEGGAPCGGVSGSPCCQAPWLLASASSPSDAPQSPLFALLPSAPGSAALPALVAHRAPVRARAAPDLALHTILRL